MLLAVMAGAASAQRHTDRLDRGLVAVPANVNGASGSGNFVSWKIFGEEYYNTTYNLYANGQLIKGDLKVGCFSHTGGAATTRYQVAAVVNGVEQEKCAEVTRWSNGYKDIMVKPVTDRAGATVTSMYELNDISLGDVTGDGIPEFIVKRNYTGSNPGLTESGNKTRFNLYECYTLAGERLWSIDLGPNLMAGPDEQWDLVAYDWDEDGKAECVMRGADNMIIHTATGHDIEIGNMNYYAPRDEYTREGNEYLLYLNGETGEPFAWNGQTDKFTPMAYPLPRFESGESDYATVWGKNDTGHRATKHYFGAPVLDGKHASIFLGRGCYTRHKMCALDVNPQTHALTQRWRWNEYSGSSPWFGNGFHNFAIGDVDWDGRDEIIFGSMIIDDNGRGLCTTGLGHGDSQHCADLDPYRHGSEQFTCNETRPACTYFNAVTGKYYYRLASTTDDGRALAANFSNSFPGSMGRTTQTGIISLTADKVITDGAPASDSSNDALFWSHLNQRIYWDGDLLDEVFDSPGSAAREGAIYKPGGGRLFTTSGCNTSNSSKNNPGAIADIFGDWREEVVMRAEGNTRIRIYTTAIPTTYRIYTLWHDHQYRNAMVWQCVGYNQTPHKSYFLGQLEGITIAPPPLTNTGRTLIDNGATIGTATDGQHVLVYDTEDIAVSVADGAQPSVATFNVPSWVQGTNSNIVNGTAVVNRQYFTCNVTGGAFAGNMRLVKQGDGILNLPAVEQLYTGPTDIWAGTLNFDGKMQQTSLWLNRFAELNSNGGQFRSIKADYAAIVRPGGADQRGVITTDSLTLGFGSRLVIDIYAEGTTADCVNTKYLSIDTRLTGNWLTYGPQYLQPVIEVANHGEDIAAGSYLVFDGVEDLKGKLQDIIIEGLGTSVICTLHQDGTKIYLDIKEPRTAGDVVWTGAASSDWAFGGDNNFRLTAASETEATPESFVSGDVVRFTDEGTKLTVNLKGDIEADSVIVDASKNYIFKGTGALVGNTTLVKRGTGNLTVQTDNSYTGGTRISGGKLTIGSLSNENQALGHLGAVITSASKFIIEDGGTLATTAAVTQGSPMMMRGDEGGIIDHAADFVANKAISGTKLTKRGNGWMKLHADGSLTRLVVAAGAINLFANKPAQTVELQGGSIYDDVQGTQFAIEVPKGKSGTFYLTNTYYTAYNNKVTGEGTLTIVPRNTVSRVRITGDWSKFEGTIKHTTTGIWLPLDATTGIPKGTLDIAEGCTVTNVAKAFAIGRLTGKGSLAHPVANFQNSNAVSGSNTWNVGNSDDLDFTFAGTFTDGGGSNKAIFNKVGSCKMTVSGKSDHSGATAVKGGELFVKSGATIGKGALTVAKGATLAGVTTKAVPFTNASVSIAAGGTVRVGASETSATGSMFFNDKNVTFNSGSKLILNVASKSAYNTLKGIGRLTMNGTIQLNILPSQTLAVGDELILWEATSVSGTPQLESLYIAEGLYWDVSELNVGKLKVTDEVPSGISSTAAGTAAETDLYTIDGRRANRTRAGQVYVTRGRKVIVK